MLNDMGGRDLWCICVSNPQEFDFISSLLLYSNVVLYFYVNLCSVVKNNIAPGKTVSFLRILCSFKFFRSDWRPSILHICLSIQFYSIFVTEWQITDHTVMTVHRQVLTLTMPWIQHLEVFSTRITKSKLAKCLAFNLNSDVFLIVNSFF